MTVFGVEVGIIQPTTPEVTGHTWKVRWGRGFQVSELVLKTIFGYFGKAFNHLVNAESCNKEMLSWLLKRHTCVGAVCFF